MTLPSPLATSSRPLPCVGAGTWQTPLFRELNQQKQASCSSRFLQNWLFVTLGPWTGSLQDQTSADADTRESNWSKTVLILQLSQIASFNSPEPETHKRTMARIMATLWGMFWPAEPLIRAERMLHGAEPSPVLLMVARVLEATQLIRVWVSPQSEVSVHF